MKAPWRKPGVGIPNESSPGGTALIAIGRKFGVVASLYIAPSKCSYRELRDYVTSVPHTTIIVFS